MLRRLVSSWRRRPSARLRALEAERELLTRRCAEVLRERDVALRALRESNEMLRAAASEIADLSRRDTIGRCAGRA